MQLSLRWYGESDPVALSAIRQIPGVKGIVGALHDLAPGVVWPADAVVALRQRVEDAGFVLNCIESIPVPEVIKLGAEGREAAADAWCRSVEAVGAAGIPVVCYNLMPVFDWTRTSLGRPLGDGTEAMAYLEADVEFVHEALAAGGLPGWMERHTAADLKRLFAAYAEIDTERMWDHVGWFLERVVPVAEAAGVKLAVHPDDPPWSLFGLPRVITSAKALHRLCDLVDSPSNGVTFCTGSLGADPELPAGLAEDAASLLERGRLHFAHLRNVRRLESGPRDFTEVAHPDGDVDLGAVIQALVDGGFDGPLRPDHGRQIWDERDGERPPSAPSVRPGYGLYDRALGATYLLGLWEATARRGRSGV